MFQPSASLTSSSLLVRMWQSKNVHAQQVSSSGVDPTAGKATRPKALVKSKSMTQNEAAEDLVHQLSEDESKKTIESND